MRFALALPKFCAQSIPCRWVVWVARDWSAPGVASEVEATPGALRLQPRARLGAVETVPEALQLVLDERVERIEDQRAHCWRSQCSVLVIPLRDPRRPSPPRPLHQPMIPPVPLRWLRTGSPPH